MDSIQHERLRRAVDYRNKAEELRVIAATLTNEHARAMFLSMAEDYIHMAEVLEHLAGAKRDDAP